MTTQPSRNAPCPCGSGKRYKHCHGAPGQAKTVPAERVVTKQAGTPVDVAPANDTPPSTQTTLMQALQHHKAGRIEEAERLYNQLLDSGFNHPHVLHYLGVIHYQRMDYAQAEKRIRDALTMDDNLPMGYNNLGLVLREKADLHNALSCFDKAITQDRHNAPAYNNRAAVLSDLGRHVEALRSCDQALELQSNFTEALVNRGKAQLALKQFAAAATSYKRALELQANIPYIAGQWVHSMMKACDWTSLKDGWNMLVTAVDDEQAASSPFPLGALPVTPVQQQRCARFYSRDRHPIITSPLWTRRLYDHDRIRIGYLSTDFHNHPTAHLMSRLVECHDRTGFETIGISIGPVRQDAWSKRLEDAFDAFHDVHAHSDREIAQLIHELEIDILVDLNGHTEGSRTDICAMRPAPIQVNFLGYPGTMGAEYIDYIVADHTLIPDRDRQFYDEKVVYLPHSYQVNDSTKPIADRDFSRSELGLPEDAFVFCCFNDNYKITPELFDVWMRLLNRIQGSVLWLLSGSQEAETNLCTEAFKRGIDPERLIFAPRMDLADHLARHKQADLFLDTLYYNAHTTASDALWAGLPILTRIGETFAGRVAASLLRAVGLPELVTDNLADYESLALDLASDPQRLATIRTKLAQNRMSEPLFDTIRYTHHLEAAFRLMVERQRAGLAPDHIMVPAEPDTQAEAKLRQEDMDKNDGDQGTLASLWKKIFKFSQ